MLETNDKRCRRFAPPQPTRGSGVRCKLPNPKQGLGHSPGQKRVLVHFELELTDAVTTNFILDRFLDTQRKGHQLAINCKGHPACRLTPKSLRLWVWL